MRDVLEDHGVGYVLAVLCDHRVSRAGTSMRADAVAERPAPAHVPGTAGWPLYVGTA
jgi:hypothetical protein